MLVNVNVVVVVIAVIELVDLTFLHRKELNL